MDQPTDKPPTKPGKPKKRKAGRPPSAIGAFAPLRSLKCFPQIRAALLGHQSISELARWIQEDKKEYTNITRQSLITILTAFRKQMPPLEVVRASLPEEPPTKVKNALDALCEGMDELKEMERLYRLQMQRVETDYGTEMRIGKLFTNMGQEVRISREILASYAELKMDLGLTKRHIGQVDVDAKVVADVAHTYHNEAVLAAVDSGTSRKKLLDISEKIMAVVAKGQKLPDLLESHLADPSLKEEVIDVTPVDSQGIPPATTEQDNTVPETP